MPTSHNDPDKVDTVWVDGGIVKAADRFGDEIWAAPQHFGDTTISFKSVPASTGAPWVTLSAERTREFLRVLAQETADPV